MFVKDSKNGYFHFAFQSAQTEMSFAKDTVYATSSTSPM